jgi:hypothetical protein
MNELKWSLKELDEYYVKYEYEWCLKNDPPKSMIDLLKKNSENLSDIRVCFCINKTSYEKWKEENENKNFEDYLKIKDSDEIADEYLYNEYGSAGNLIEKPFRYNPESDQVELIQKEHDDWSYTFCIKLWSSEKLPDYELGDMDVMDFSCQDYSDIVNFYWVFQHYHKCGFVGDIPEQFFMLK